MTPAPATAEPLLEPEQLRAEAGSLGLLRSIRANA